MYICEQNKWTTWLQCLKLMKLLDCPAPDSVKLQEFVNHVEFGFPVNF
jgi:hypothetical protein